MSNRTDFENVASELIEMFGLDPDAENPNTGKLRWRIERELHNAFVAGQESVKEPASLSFDVSGPGMAELRTIERELRSGLERIEWGASLSTTERGLRNVWVNALLRAVRAVLGLDHPRIVEGPGIPELRIALAVMPPSLEYTAPAPLRKLIEAAQVVTGERQ